MLRLPPWSRTQFRTASLPRTFTMFGMMIRSGSPPSRASSSANVKWGTTSRPPDSAKGTFRSATVITLNVPAVLNTTYGASVSPTSVTPFPSTTATVGLCGSSSGGVGKSRPAGCTRGGARYVASADRNPKYPTLTGTARNAVVYTTTLTSVRIVILSAPGFTARLPGWNVSRPHPLHLTLLSKRAARQDPPQVVRDLHRRENADVRAAGVSRGRS